MKNDFSFEAIVRPNIAQLKPYRSARSEHQTGRLLDANENSFGSVFNGDGLHLNRYPDPFQTALRTEISKRNGVGIEQVFCGVGSDEIIDLLIRITCTPGGDNVLLIEPTYGMYRTSAEIHDAEVRSVLLNVDFQPDVQRTLEATDANTKLIFLCSPNNPTGNLIDRQRIVSIARKTNALVVVDEAYLDFAEGDSLIMSITEVPNLVVMRTFSKAWGLAGLRLGWCVAAPEVVSYLMKVKAPYNINVLSSRMALQAFSFESKLKRIVEYVRAERKRLTSALAELKFVRRVFPSDANFLLVRFKDSTRVFEYLKENGIIVRDRRGEPMLENCLRITIGTPSENDALILLLRKFKG